MPERNPQLTIKPPIGASSANTDFKFKPILVSMSAAMKMVHVEIIADIYSGKNDMLISKKTREYIKNGIGIKSMNKTAKKTPTAYDLF